jgi:small-conductance mechanosensitive channel
MQRLFLTQTQWDGVTLAASIAIAIVAGVIVHRVLYWALGRMAKRRHSAFTDALIRRTCRPAAYILPLLAILATVPNLVLPESWSTTVLRVTGLLTIGGISWTIITTIQLYSDVIIARHRIDVEDNLFARQLGTRVDILTRATVIVVIIVAVGMELMTFPEVRTIGTTLLASAGLAGIVVGLAARPLFENLVAGIQLALTQPIRLDDVVVIETQFGRIEEIHSTYVVVRLWDLRRLVVPLTYFISTPFENWTRRTANLMGEVYVFADWTLDAAALRAEIPKIVARSPLWDKQFQNLQVTEVTDRAVQIRALVTARNSGDLFDLRCFVREEIVAYIRDHQPNAMPKLRVELPSGHDTPPNRNGTQEPRLTDESIARAIVESESAQQKART